MSATVATSEDELADAVKRLVDQLAQRQTKTDERRSCQRHPFNLPVEICTKNHRGTIDQEMMAWALNLSYQGIELISSRTILPSDSMLINFEPAIGHKCCVPVKLVHTSKLVNGVYLSGGEFLFAFD